MSECTVEMETVKLSTLSTTKSGGADDEVAQQLVNEET